MKGKKGYPVVSHLSPVDPLNLGQYMNPATVKRKARTGV